MKTLFANGFRTRRFRSNTLPGRLIPPISSPKKCVMALISVGCGIPLCLGSLTFCLIRFWNHIMFVSVLQTRLLLRLLGSPLHPALLLIFQLLRSIRSDGRLLLCLICAALVGSSFGLFMASSLQIGCDFTMVHTRYTFTPSFLLSFSPSVPYSGTHSVFAFPMVFLWTHGWGVSGLSVVLECSLS